MPAGPEPAPGVEKKPKKAKGRSKVPLVLAGALLVVLVGTGVAFGVSYFLESSAEEEIWAAVALAEDDGLRSSLDAAVALVEEHDDDDPEDLALRARLYAMLVMEHAEMDRAAPANEILDDLDEEGAASVEAIIATAYLSLAEGDVERAKAAVAAEPAEVGASAAELAQARALALAAGGEYARAFAASEEARQLRPSAPRYIGENAILTARTDDVQAALALLDGLPDGGQSALARIARARIVKIANSDPDRAASEATEVLEALSDTATPPQKAWAHLIRAWHATIHGDLTRAISEGRAARETRPPGDEAFALELADVMVKANAFDDAAETLASLPQTSVSPARRARLVAAVALGRGEISEAEAALADAGDGAQAEFMRGRVAEAKNQLEAAASHYRAAMSRDTALTPPASARLGAIAAQNGDHAEAVELLRPMAEQYPSNIEVVPLLVDSLLALDRADDAEEVLEQAINFRRPDGVDVAVELLLSRSQVELARGDAAAAVATLTSVVERRPDFADLHRALGEAALIAGDLDTARTAFERVQELVHGDDGQALAGLAYVEISEGADLEAAAAAITRAEEAGGRGRFLDRAKARMMVLEGKGHEAAEVIQPMTRESPNDVGLWVALGQAYLQAVSNGRAERAFEKALELDEKDPDALLGMALVRTRAGSTDRASRYINRAEAAVRERELGDTYVARIKAAEGRVLFELGRLDDAREKAAEATRLDSACAAAHLLIASIGMEHNEVPVDDLQRAVEGSPPSVEAMGLLVVERGTTSEENCNLARRYLAAAPRGLDARVVRRFVRRCR
jgi:tetratricopeptide (TPR) repeat protein